MLKDILNLEGVEVLSKHQQKFISGGNIPSGTCAVQGGNGYYGVSGVSKAYAIEAAGATGGHWCCDSCQSATWLSLEHKAYLA